MNFNGRRLLHCLEVDAVEPGLFPHALVLGQYDHCQTNITTQLPTRRERHKLATFMPSYLSTVYPGRQCRASSPSRIADTVDPVPRRLQIPAKRGRTFCWS